MNDTIIMTLLNKKNIMVLNEKYNKDLDFLEDMIQIGLENIAL